MRTVKLALFPAWKYPRILQAASFFPTKCTWKTGEIFGGLEKLMGVITPAVLKIPNPDLKETGVTCQVGMLKPKKWTLPSETAVMEEQTDMRRV